MRQLLELPAAMPIVWQRSSYSTMSFTLPVSQCSSYSVLFCWTILNLLLLAMLDNGGRRLRRRLRQSLGRQCWRGLQPGSRRGSPQDWWQESRWQSHYDVRCRPPNNPAGHHFVQSPMSSVYHIPLRRRSQHPMLQSDWVNLPHILEEEVWGATLPSQIYGDTGSRNQEQYWGWQSQLW